MVTGSERLDEDSGVDRSAPRLGGIAVAGPDDPPPIIVSSIETRRRRGWSWFFVIAGALTLAILLAGQIRLDYFAFYPGSATPTAPLVEVDGVERFDAEGTLYFTTVSSREVTVFDWIGAKFDPSVDLIERDVILGGRTVDERRDDNRQAMLGSQETAELVALQYLGFEALTLSGALVAGVQEGSAADGVLDPGDVITSFEGIEILSQTDLVDAVGQNSPGDTVVLAVRGIDADAPAERSLVLGANDEGNPLLGINVMSDVQPSTDLPFDLSIDAGNVGGPSAGLAWTLTVIDLLTEGELTGNQRVAVTGTMSIDGAVGPIGGITQKTYAVREQGIDVFIVPEANAELAFEHAGDDLMVFPVENLDDAIAALAGIGGDVDLESAEEILAGS